MMKDKKHKVTISISSVRCRTLLRKESKWKEQSQVGANRVYKIHIKKGGEL